MQERLADRIRGLLLPAEASHGDEQNDGTVAHRNLRNIRFSEGRAIHDALRTRANHTSHSRSVWTNSRRRELNPTRPARTQSAGHRSAVCHLQQSSQFTCED